MYIKFAPIIMIVLSSLCYHISQKSIPIGLNPIVTLIVTYVMASIVSIISYFIFIPKSSIMNLVKSVGYTNWTSLLLGFAVVGLELGFLLAYRSGWNISTAGLLSNTLVALLLIPVGLVCFKESISVHSVIGISVCILGLVLVSK